ncbi:hypothetical protein N7470_001371 [Penicillium chermesinum]|nr:hypothetical protein N7470_001371 [Penicillium chermesinum]
MEGNASEDAAPAAPQLHSPHLHADDSPDLPDDTTDSTLLQPEPQSLEPSVSAQDAPTGSPKARPVSGVVPPYWQRHERGSSRASQASLRSTLITLEDHTADPDSETSRGLWARSVTIDDHVVVRGRTGVGAYVGGPMVVRMRYSEFDDLRQRLVLSFPHAKNALPALPPKSVLFKFRPDFLEQRRAGLEYFLNCVLLNPEFSSSPVVKDFLFGRLS